MPSANEILADEQLLKTERRFDDLIRNVWLGAEVSTAAVEGKLLCMAAREVRTRLVQCEGSRRVHELDNHHNALACGYCAGPLRDELLSLQSQLEQLRAENVSLRGRVLELETDIDTKRGYL